MTGQACQIPCCPGQNDHPVYNWTLLLDGVFNQVTPHNIAHRTKNPITFDIQLVNITLCIEQIQLYNVLTYNYNHRSYVYTITNEIPNLSGVYTRVGLYMDNFIKDNTIY